MDLDFERTLVSLAFTLFKHRTKGVGWIRGRALEEAFSSSGDPAPLVDSHADRSVVDSATVRSGQTGYRHHNSDRERGSQSATLVTIAAP